MVTSTDCPAYRLKTTYGFRPTEKALNEREDHRVAVSGPFPRDGDYAAFYRLLAEKPCQGNPDIWAHEYIEPIDSRTWCCAICNTSGPFETGESDN